MNILNKYNFKMSTVNYVLTSGIFTTVPPVKSATMDIKNFKVSSRGMKVRTLGTTQRFTVQFGQLRAVDLIHVNGTNLTLGASIQIIGTKNGAEVYNSDVIQFVEPIQLGEYGADFGLLPLGGYEQESFIGGVNFTKILESVIVMDTCDIILNAPHNTYIDVSKILISQVFSPLSTNIAYGLSLSYKNANSVERVGSGSAAVSKKYTIRVITITIDKYDEADRGWISNIFQKYVGTPCYITCFPYYGGRAEADFSGMFILTGDQSITHPFYGRYESSNLIFEEM